MPWDWIFAQIIGDGRSAKVLKWWSYIDVWHFYDKDKFASPCICMGPIHLYGKMLRIHILDISIIQLNWSLMMSIRPLSRHKLAKWADRKSKMAITAAILNINFRHLFPNFWSPWAKTCSVATGWLLDRNELKMCWSEIQDDRSGSAPLNKVATGAKNRKSSNHISSLANGLISKYLHRSVPPIPSVALYQNC